MPRRVLWLLLWAVLCACDTPTAAEPEPRLFHLGASYTLLELAGGVVQATQHPKGEVLWEYRGERRRDASFGRYADRLLACPPQLSADNSILLTYDSDLVWLDATTGEPRWTRQIKNRRACPAITPDSGVAVALMQAGRLKVLKLGAGGEESFRAALPEVGEPTDALRANAATGDILLRTRTHLVALSPTGGVNWVRPLQEAAAPAGASR